MYIFFVLHVLYCTVLYCIFKLVKKIKKIKKIKINIRPYVVHVPLTRYAQTSDRPVEVQWSI